MLRRCSASEPRVPSPDRLLRPRASQEIGEALAARVAALAGDNAILAGDAILAGGSVAVDACCGVADEGFRRGAHELAR